MAGPFRIKKLELLDSLDGTDAVGVEPGFGIQCVGLVKYYSNCGASGDWDAGSLVRDTRDLKRGIAIATFEKNGKYASKAKGNHACFFIEFVGELGFLVLEQHVKPHPEKIQQRLIRYQDGISFSASDNANRFSVIL